MPSEITWISAFLVGLLGSVHCIGMCGGIVGALTMGLSESIRGSPLRMLPYLLSYNAGRIASYALAGALAGFLGAQASQLFTHGSQLVGQIISGAFMIALGLYLGGWLQVLTVLERAGAKFWHTIEPLGRRFLPVRGKAHALGLGLVWGWLPCGMVYAVLVWSLTAGGAPQGAILMVAFGLGTLPMLLTMGAAAHRLGARVRRPFVRQLAGVAVILFGLYSLFAPGTHADHSAHRGQAAHPAQQAIDE